MVRAFGVLNGLCTLFPFVLQLSLINKTENNSTTQVLFTPCNTRPLVTETSAKEGKEASLFDTTGSHKAPLYCSVARASNYNHTDSTGHVAVREGTSLLRRNTIRIVLQHSCQMVVVGLEVSLPLPTLLLPLLNW